MSLRILVTGGAGFIGSRLVRRLHSGGHSLAIILRESTNPWRISDILPRMTVVNDDLRELSVARRRLTTFQPECAVHLAWQGVGNRQRNEISQIDNLRSGYEFLRLTRDLGCRHYVGLGSQAEYGPHSEAMSEEVTTCPTTLYGTAKLCHCLQAEKFCRENGLRFSWLRLFSAYGPGDDPEWMIPQVILRLLRRERPALTAGQQRWDYLYADDAAEAIASVACSAEASGIFNLGSGEAAPLRCIVEQLRDLIDPSLPLGFGEVPYRPDQVMHLEANISRLTKSTGWTPRTELRSGLRSTIEWYRHHGS